MEGRVVAVDWSGRSGRDQARHIWVCETVGGEVATLENGRSRREVVAHLVALAGRDPELLVGLDFCFAVPAWYLAEAGLAAAPDLWASLAEERLTPRMRELGLAGWLGDPDEPFWRSRRPAKLTPDRAFRRTELDHAAPGVKPKSVFQLVGAGQVGRGSLYGMQALHELALAGFSVWPLTAAGRPCAVEIYPRLLTGSVVKSDADARATHLAGLALRDEHRAAATASEDAFDALVSALAMSRADAGPTAAVAHPYDLEGRIWTP